MTIDSDEDTVYTVTSTEGQINWHGKTRITFQVMNEVGVIDKSKPTIRLFANLALLANTFGPRGVDFPEDKLEHLLNCMANERFFTSIPRHQRTEARQIIDKAYRDARDLLHGDKKSNGG